MLYASNEVYNYIYIYIYISYILKYIYPIQFPPSSPPPQRLHSLIKFVGESGDRGGIEERFRRGSGEPIRGGSELKKRGGDV